jgi:hypothetical protein
MCSGNRLLRKSVASPRPASGGKSKTKQRAAPTSHARARSRKRVTGTGSENSSRFPEIVWSVRITLTNVRHTLPNNKNISPLARKCANLHAPLEGSNSTRPHHQARTRPWNGRSKQGRSHTEPCSHVSACSHDPEKSQISQRQCTWTTRMRRKSRDRALALFLVRTKSFEEKEEGVTSKEVSTKRAKARSRRSQDEESSGPVTTKSRIEKSPAPLTVWGWARSTRSR